MKQQIYGEGIFGVRYLLNAEEDITKYFITETARDTFYERCKQNPMCSVVRKTTR